MLKHKVPRKSSSTYHNPAEKNLTACFTIHQKQKLEEEKNQFQRQETELTVA